MDKPTKGQSPTDCCGLEGSRYLATKRIAMAMFRLWTTYMPLQQAVFIGFIHYKGEGALYTSILLRKPKSTRPPAAILQITPHPSTANLQKAPASSHRATGGTIPVKGRGFAGLLL